MLEHVVDIALKLGDVNDLLQSSWLGRCRREASKASSTTCKVFVSSRFMMARIAVFFWHGATSKPLD
jgi:hypothetical protein